MIIHLSFVSLVGCHLSGYTHFSKPWKMTLTFLDLLNIMSEENGINFSQTLQDALMKNYTSH